jgi:hypothetical protein
MDSTGNRLVFPGFPSSSSPSCVLCFFISIALCPVHPSISAPRLPSQPMLILQSYLPSSATHRPMFPNSCHSYNDFRKALSGSTPFMPRSSPMLYSKTKVWSQSLLECTVIWVVWFMPARCSINVLTQKPFFTMP